MDYIHRSNNTNKFNPQELDNRTLEDTLCSNNTNKFNPQELSWFCSNCSLVQIIQINSILKNARFLPLNFTSVQIIQINSILKNG